MELTTIATLSPDHTEEISNNETHFDIPDTKGEIDVQPVSTSKPFIQANTIESSIEEIRNKHIIPVFIKDNEPAISHADFIDIATEVASEIYHGEHILKPSIRLSHPVKGRIPEAKNKSAKELLEHEKTLYYERMAFVIEIPSIYDEIDGNMLSLTIGGVKAPQQKCYTI